MWLREDRVLELGLDVLHNAMAINVLLKACIMHKVTAGGLLSPNSNLGRPTS